MVSGGKQFFSYQQIGIFAGKVKFLPTTHFCDSHCHAAYIFFWNRGGRGWRRFPKRRIMTAEEIPRIPTQPMTPIAYFGIFSLLACWKAMCFPAAKKFTLHKRITSYLFIDGFGSYGKGINHKGKRYTVDCRDADQSKIEVSSFLLRPQLNKPV